MMLPLSSSRDLRSAIRRSIDAIFWVVVIINSFDLLFGAGERTPTFTPRRHMGLNHTRLAIPPHPHIGVDSRT